MLDDSLQTSQEDVKVISGWNILTNNQVCAAVRWDSEILTSVSLGKFDIINYLRCSDGMFCIILSGSRSVVFQYWPVGKGSLTFRFTYRWKRI